MSPLQTGSSDVKIGSPGGKSDLDLRGYSEEKYHGCPFLVILSLSFAAHTLLDGERLKGWLKARGEQRNLKCRLHSCTGGAYPLSLPNTQSVATVRTAIQSAAT